MSATVVLSFSLLSGVPFTGGSAAFGQGPITDPSLGDRCLERMQPTDPTQPPASDFGNAEEVSEKFRAGLGSYVSYAQAYWHSDGGMRVRIARNRTDTAQAKQRAQELINTTETTFSGGIQIEDTDISSQDLRAWEADARNGLTYIPKADIKSANANELCQYVMVTVTSPETAQLTAEEREKYTVLGVPQPSDHSRPYDESPYNGGLRMKGTAGGSTAIVFSSAFTVLRSGTRFMSSAGHCDASNAWYTTHGGNYIGSEFDNPWEGGSSADVQILSGMTYNSPVWWGEWDTTQTVFVTAKWLTPPLGVTVQMSGGRSGVETGIVTDTYDPSCGGRTAVLVTFNAFNRSQQGDSGSPWMAGNGSTSRTDDVIAAGVHACLGNDAVNDYGWFTRVGLLQDATNSSVVLSSP